MAIVEFNLDITEDAYVTFEGETLHELEEFLYENRIFKDCCGSITYKDEIGDTDLCIAALKGYGVYLGYVAADGSWLSVSDRSKLCSLLDVWGDGLYVSEGLFINPHLAWEAICEFVKTGRRSMDVEWMSYDELPEEGNCLC